MSERLSQEPRPTTIVGPTAASEHYQRHPIRGQMQLGIMTAGYRERPLCEWCGWCNGGGLGEDPHAESCQR